MNENRIAQRLNRPRILGTLVSGGPCVPKVYRKDYLARPILIGKSLSSCYVDDSLYALTRGTTSLSYRL